MVLIKDKNENTLYIDPSDAVPVNHKNIDIRTRLYLTEKDPYVNLHQLMNSQIVCFPIYEIGESLQTHSTYVVLEHVIALPQLGFLYLGLKYSMNEGVCLANFYDEEGKVNSVFVIHIDLSTYSELLEMTEMDIEE